MILVSLRAELIYIGIKYVLQVRSNPSSFHVVLALEFRKIKDHGIFSMVSESYCIYALCGKGVPRWRPWEAKGSEGPLSGTMEVKPGLS